MPAFSRNISISPARLESFVRLDAVSYHLGSGEIETRGNARVTIKKAQ